MRTLLILIFSSFLFLSWIKLNDSLINSSGAQIRFTRKTLEDAVESLIKVVQKRSHNLPDFPNTKVSGSFWPFPLWITLSKLVIDNIIINSKQTELELFDDGRIKIHFGETEVYVRGVCYIYQSHFPPWEATYKMSDYLKFNYVNMVLKIRNQQGSPEIDVLQSDANLDELTINFDGDIGKIFANIIIKLFNNELKGLLQNQINQNLKLAGTSLTSALATIPLVLNLSGMTEEFYVSYQLNADPHVSIVGQSKDLIVPIVSQFWSKGHRDDPDMKRYVNSSGTYPQYASPQDLCIDVDSNLMFKSAAYAFNRSDLSTKIVISDEDFWHLKPKKRSYFSCDCLGDLCFTQAFHLTKDQCKTGETIKIAVTAQILPKELQFNKSGIYFLANGDGRFIIEDAKTGNILPLIEIDMDVWVKINTDVDLKNWTLFSNFSIPSYSRISATSKDITNITDALLVKIWNEILQDVANIELNKLISYGLPLPIINFATFDNYQITHKGQFLQLCSDIKWDFSTLFPTLKARKHKHKSHQKRRQHSQIRYVYVPFYVPIYSN